MISQPIGPEGFAKAIQVIRSKKFIDLRAQNPELDFNLRRIFAEALAEAATEAALPSASYPDVQFEVGDGWFQMAHSSAGEVIVKVANLTQSELEPEVRSWAIVVRDKLREM